MDQYTREQFLAALEALGLDAETTSSVYIAPDWVRVEHTDRPATSIPVNTPDEPDQTD
ncbi:hypothetical protein OVA14_07255 [Agrococcus sp. SL85]|uniref:hypothetical protein n=1 Tax=Agrococcus sp. SL85 TaxID=2995141 RepID=UPI00226D3150|nr:hypothetical protein [Agrococcus sp. SL85]WAC65190.1 hypothetical protein OVA14_07255 [Agrococcus sp. SL85]